MVGGTYCLLCTLHYSLVLDRVWRNEFYAQAFASAHIEKIECYALSTIHWCWTGYGETNSMLRLLQAPISRSERRGVRKKRTPLTSGASHSFIGSHKSFWRRVRVATIIAYGVGKSTAVTDTRNFRQRVPIRLYLPPRSDGVEAHRTAPSAAKEGLFQQNTDSSPDSPRSSNSWLRTSPLTAAQ